MGVFPVYLCTLCVSGQRVKKRVLDPLGLELCTPVVSCHVGAGTGSQVPLATEPARPAPPLSLATEKTLLLLWLITDLDLRLSLYVVNTVKYISYRDLYKAFPSARLFIFAKTL